LPVHWLPLAAVTDAAIFAVLVSALTLAAPRDGPMRMLLYGVAIGALAKAVVTLMMILGPVYRSAQLWSGSRGRSPRRIWPMS
jgi:iron complex transport system permease protein